MQSETGHVTAGRQTRPRRGDRGRHSFAIWNTQSSCVQAQENTRWATGSPMVREYVELNPVLRERPCKHSATTASTSVWRWQQWLRKFGLGMMCLAVPFPFRKIGRKLFTFSGQSWSGRSPPGLLLLRQILASEYQVDTREFQNLFSCRRFEPRTRNWHNIDSQVLILERCSYMSHKTRVSWASTVLQGTNTLFSGCPKAKYVFK